MKQFIKIFNKVGGKEILRQYTQAHVLFFSFIITLLLGFSKKSLEIVRLAVGNKILLKIRKKYRPFIEKYKKENASSGERKTTKKVWICWLQGMDTAPLLVKKCYKSLKENLQDREIILLTEENYHDYIKFPCYIQEKIDKGIISRTHMSDLLRLELLITYGGTWIDATVFCSGNNIPEYMLESELFLFQDLKPGLDGHCTCISSWFITACTNHPILLLTRALLYEYWKTNTKMLDYFLIHDFFQLAIEAYPEEWDKVMPCSNSTTHILLLRLFEEYNEELWNELKKMMPFHKLSYKFDKEKEQIEKTYYKKIISEDKML